MSSPLAEAATSRHRLFRRHEAPMCPSGGTSPSRGGYREAYHPLWGSPKRSVGDKPPSAVSVPRGTDVLFQRNVPVHFRRNVPVHFRRNVPVHFRRNVPVHFRRNVPVHFRRNVPVHFRRNVPVHFRERERDNDRSCLFYVNQFPCQVILSRLIPL